MGFLIALLTILLVVDCLLLVLLVIIQLPKKEAGLGIAFGGAAADALFGPGSGTILTKTTKYLTVAFFVLTLMLASMYLKQHRGTRSEILKAVGATEETVPVRGGAGSGALPGAVPAAPASGPAPIQDAVPQSGDKSGPVSGSAANNPQQPQQ